MTLRLAGLIVAGLVTLAPASVRAGAWTLEPGEAVAIVGGVVSRSDRAFERGGELRRIPRYEKDEVQTLFEYGAADGLTVLLGPTFDRIALRGSFPAEYSGAGYTDVGARARIGGGEGWVASLQATFRAPGTRDRGDVAAIGYTDPEIDLRALFGYAFEIGGRPAFVDLEAAQRIRTGGPPDEFRADLTFGLRPHERWLLLVQSFNVMSEGSGTWGYGSYAYHKAQLSLVYALTPRVSLQFGGFSTFAGRNALQENAFILALWYRF